jgi:hypothetical protein
MQQLEKFFERLFDNEKDLFKYYQKTEGYKKIRCYQFGSMRDIRAFITTAYGYDDWDNDEEADDEEKSRPPKKVKVSHIADELSVD